MQARDSLSAALNGQKLGSVLRKINYSDPLWDESAVIAALIRQHELLGLPIPEFRTLETLEQLGNERPVPSTEYYPRLHRLTALVTKQNDLPWPRTQRAPSRPFLRRGLQVVARHAIRDAAGLSSAWPSRYINDVTEDVFRTIRILVIPLRDDNAKRLVDIGMCAIEAAVYGMGYYIATPDVFYLVPLPRMTFEEGVLHNEQGKAVEWRGGEGYYFLRGVEFSADEHSHLMSGELTSTEFTKMVSADKRAIALSYFRPDELIKELEATLVDVGKKGTRLYKTWLFPDAQIRSEAAYFMLMDDASTDRQFIEWVPPKVGREGNAELCQAEAFGITLDEWLSIEQEG